MLNKVKVTKMSQNQFKAKDIKPFYKQNIWHYEKPWHMLIWFRDLNLSNNNMLAWTLRLFACCNKEWLPTPTPTHTHFTSGGISMPNSALYNLYFKWTGSEQMEVGDLKKKKR